MISEKLRIIETGIKNVIESVFQNETMQKDFAFVFNHVFTNGTDHLEDVSLYQSEVEGLKAVYIDDQNVDFYLQKNGDVFRLFAKKEDEELKEIGSIEDFRELNYFVITFKSLLSEIEGAREVQREEYSEMDAVSSTVGYWFDQLFAEVEEELLANYATFSTPDTYTTRIKVYEVKDEIDFSALFDLPKEISTLEHFQELENNRYRDMFIMKRGNEAFVMVVHSNEDDEDFGKDVELKFFYTNDEDNNCISLDSLQKDYLSHHRRPIFNYRYNTRRVKGEWKLRRTSDDDSAIVYWSQLKGFFKEWEKLSASLAGNK